MSVWYNHKGSQVKVIRHLDGNELVIWPFKREELRIQVSDEVADIVDQMLEFAYLSGKEMVRTEIKSKLGLGE